MLILLPPSEGKTAPTAGAPVDLSALSHPELAAARERVGNALAKVSSQRNAFEVLGVGPSLSAEVARNRDLWTNPAAPASAVYSGVLYDAAGMSTWDQTLRARSADQVRIVSALWGAVAPGDLIPAYRLSMSTSLGRIGALAPFWRKHLAAALGHLSDGQLVVDCRSAAYVAAWRPSGAQHASVRVERDLGGKRTVVSHMAKHTRGLLTAHLLREPQAPHTIADLADSARAMEGVIDVAVTAHELTVVIRG